MQHKKPLTGIIHQILLLVILLGLLLGTTLPARADAGEDSWSLRDVVRSIEPSVVWIVADLGKDTWSQGSGFIVHEDGYVLTNAHVVEGALGITVGWPDRFDRSEKEATVVATDPNLDVALLHIESVHLPTVAIGSSESACLGDAVITLGYPAGDELGLGGLTVTRGVLSCVRRDASGEVSLLQTDAAITLGCSGGPLYDLDTGTVIGVVQGKGTLLLEGFNFAIPSERIFSLSGTEQSAGIQAAIQALDPVMANDFSCPGDRSLDIFNNALTARAQMEWSEALGNFLAVGHLDGEDPLAAYGVAESYAALDQPRQALRWLERAFELGYTDFDGALESDGFSGFRDDDRFTDLVRSF